MIAFEEREGTWRGVEPHGRVWLITPVRTGWQLRFADVDRAPIHSGTYGTLQAAKEAAGPSPRTELARNLSR